MGIRLKTSDSARDRPASIRGRIVILLSVFAVITAVVLAGLLLHLRADALDAGGRTVSGFAQLANEQTVRTIQTIEQTLQAAKALIPADRQLADSDSIRRQLRDLLAGRPFLTGITVIDRQGRIVYGRAPADTGRDVSDRAFFIHHRDNPRVGFLFSAPIRARATAAQEWIIPVSQALWRPNGEFDGVILGNVDVAYFDRVWTVADDLEGLAISLYRDDGMLLMRSPFNEKAVGASYFDGPLFTRIRAGSVKGQYEVMGVIDGLRRLVVYRKLDAYPDLTLAFTQSIDHILAPWWRTVWIVVCGWLVAAATLAGLAIWLGREWGARRATEDRYRVLFKANPYPMVAVDRQTGRFLAVSNAAVKQYGWSHDELLGMHTNDIYPPEELPKIQIIPPGYNLDELPPIQGFRHRKKDGTVFDVEMILRSIEFDGRPGFLATAQDVSERVRGEKARLAAEEQLRQSQKMEAVGQLTGGIAHDFNNILFVILANTDALLEEEGLAPDMTDRLDQIDKAVQRASGLTRQLLAFSRKQPLRPQRTDLNDLVADTGKLLRRALGAEIEIESILADDLCTVDIDRSQLETALVNLCINARDAMPGGGRLLIETCNVVLDREYGASNPDAAPGAYAMVAVSDTGGGMPPETLAKVFEPFFTTKEVGKGTGLGLSMVYGFIKQSRGHIRIYSEVGRGTSIKLYLPRSDGEVEELAVRDKAPAPRGSERILVVEDEPQVRASVVQQLQSLGYAVTEASDGTAGIVAFEAAREPFDLLLTDVVMPGPLSGKLLADEAARRWPGTPVVFMSGFTETSSVRHGRLDEGAVLLSKPFRKADLAHIVRQALDARRPLAA